MGFIASDKTRCLVKTKWLCRLTRII